MPDPQSTPSRFDACLGAVLRQEGGFVDNPLDPGGATNFGITRQTLARWRKVSPWWKLPVAEVKALRRTEAAEIYQALYWTRCNAEALPAGLDLGVFDFAVNSGPDRAIKALQAELGVVADGFIGPLTLAAVRTRIGLTGIAGLIVALCDGRLSFLQRLAIAATFGTGWARRVADIRAAALAMAGATAPSQPAKGISPMNLNFLAGYKTYIVGAVMLLAGIAELLGVSIPAFAGQSAGDLLMQGLAIAATFGAGWARRVADIRAAALAMAGATAPSQPAKGTSPMNLNFLAGYKTYIVGAVMLLAGIAELLGVSIPAFAGQSAGDLLMQGLAIVFLRHGITNTVAKG